MYEVIDKKTSDSFLISKIMSLYTNEMNKTEFKIFSLIYMEMYNRGLIKETVFVSTSFLKETLGLEYDTSSKEVYSSLKDLEAKGFIVSNLKYQRKRDINGKTLWKMVNGFVNLRLSDDTIRRLEAVNFVKFDFNILTSIKNDGARKLYVLIKSSDKPKTDFTYYVHEFMEKMALGDKYKSTGILRVAYVLPAIEEVNKSTDLTISDLVIRRSGRTITGFTFLFNDNEEFKSYDDVDIFRNQQVQKMIELGVHQDKAEAVLLKRPKQWIVNVLEWAEEKKRRALMGIEKLNLALFGGLVCKMLFDRAMDKTKLYLKKIKEKFGNESTSMVMEAKKEEVIKTTKKKIDLAKQDKKKEEFVEAFKSRINKLLVEKNDILSIFNNNISLINNNIIELVNNMKSISPTISMGIMASELFKQGLIYLGDGIMKSLFSEIKSNNYYSGLNLEYNSVLLKIREVN